MTRAPKLREPQPGRAESLELVESHLARGDLGAAVAVLLPTLDRRGLEGDQADALAARALRLQGGPSPFAPDAMATVLDRLLRLVQRQEDQIAALKALLETTL